VVHLPVTEENPENTEEQPKTGTVTASVTNGVITEITLSKSGQDDITITTTSGSPSVGIQEDIPVGTYNVSAAAKTSQLYDTYTGTFTVEEGENTLSITLPDKEQQGP
jgi:hypothetical protein